MANKKISQLSSGAPVLTTDMFPIERGGLVNYKLTIQNILTLISSYLFSTLSAISTTVSTVFNSATITASNDMTIGGNLSATSTTVHHGAVTNSSTVTTAGNTVNDGATIFNGTVTTNTNLTINGATTYATTATAAFNNNLITGASATTNVAGAFATQGVTTLNSGAYVATSPSDSDSSNKIASTAFVRNNRVGVGQSWTQYGPYPNTTRTANGTAIYYNTGSKPLIVTVNSIDYAWSGNAFLYIDTAANPTVCTTLLSASSGNGAAYGQWDGNQLYGVIPPGRAYKVVSDLSFGGISTLGRWDNWAEFK